MSKDSSPRLPGVRNAVHSPPHLLVLGGQKHVLSPTDTTPSHPTLVFTLFSRCFQIQHVGSAKILKVIFPKPKCGIPVFAQ